MATKPRRLGRGLSSLISTEQPVRVETRENTGLPGSAVVGGATNGDLSTRGPDDGGVWSVALSDIAPSPFQPRRAFSDETLDSLANSIKRSGVMQPVILRPSGNGGGGAKYELVAGERRWRAAERAGIAEIPAVVRCLSDHLAAEWALVENVQREDLNPMERAAALRSMCERFGLSHAEIGERVGLDRSSVSNLIRLTDLEREIQDLIGAGSLSGGHAKALLSLDAGGVRLRLAGRAAREGWSVRRLEREARAAGRAATRPATEEAAGARAAVIADLERRLSQAVGSKVTIHADRTGTRGRVVIDFYGLDHFDGLLSRLGVERG